MTEQHDDNQMTDQDALTDQVNWTDEELTKRHDRAMEKVEELVEEVKEVGRGYPQADEQERLQILLRLDELMYEDYRLEVIESTIDTSPLYTESAMYELVEDGYMERTPIEAVRLSRGRQDTVAALRNVEIARRRGKDSGPALQDMDVDQADPPVVTLAARLWVARGITDEDGKVLTVEEAAEAIWEEMAR